MLWKAPPSAPQCATFAVAALDWRESLFGTPRLCDFTLVCGRLWPYPVVHSSTKNHSSAVSFIRESRR